MKRGGIRRAKIVPSVAWQSVHADIFRKSRTWDGAIANSGTTDSKGKDKIIKRQLPATQPPELSVEKRNLQKATMADASYALIGQWLDGVRLDRCSSDDLYLIN